MDDKSKCKRNPVELAVSERDHIKGLKSGYPSAKKE